MELEYVKKKIEEVLECKLHSPETFEKLTDYLIKFEDLQHYLIDAMDESKTIEKLTIDNYLDCSYVRYVGYNEECNVDYIAHFIIKDNSVIICGYYGD